jgi:NitT/TauT family transport system substrate-binding protein
MLTRRTFLSGVLPALAAAGCSSSDQVPGDPTVGSATNLGTAAGPPLKLLMVHFPNLCNVGARVARERGFLEAEGLDVTLLPVDYSSPEHQHTAQWLLGPDGPVRADIVFIEYPALVDLALGRLDYLVIAGEHSGCKQLIVPASSSIRTLADVKGKRIGLPTTGHDRVMWEYLARQAGLDADELHWVSKGLPIGGAEELEFVRREFAAGNLDVYAASDPAGEILVSDGVARRLVSNTWTQPVNGWYCCLIAVRRDVLDQHPRVAGALTRAWRRSAAFIEQNPAEAVALSVEKGYMAADTRQDLCARLLKEYVWMGTDRIEEDLERYFQLLIEAGRLPASPSPRELVGRVYRKPQEAA